jgi:hypothetical protein
MPRIAIPQNNYGLYSIMSQFTNSPTSNISFNYNRSVNTYPNSNSGQQTSFNNFPYPNYYFWLQVYNTNASKGSAGVTYPWTNTGTDINSNYGGSRQVFTGAITYITVSCTPTYPNTFKGWYTAASGGTLITTTANFNVGFNGPPINDPYYAQYN